MKNNRFIIPIVLVFCFFSVDGAQCDIGIFPSTSPNQMDIKIRPDYAEDGSHLLTNAQFTIKWPVSSGISSIISGPEVLPFKFLPQGPPKLNGGYYYQVFASVPNTNPVWTANAEFVAHTFKFSPPSCPCSTTFEIADDAYVHELYVNGAFWIDMNGVSRTGIIYQPSNQLSTNCDNYHYRTLRTGNWTDPDQDDPVWEKSLDGSLWEPSLGSYPDFSVLTIKVRAGHTITAIASISIDQFTIEAGGKVTVPDGTVLTNIGSASDFMINSTSTTGTNNSGSLMTQGTGTVTGPVTYNRFMRADYYQYFSSPVAGQEFSTWSPGRDKTLWEWNEPTGAWNSALTETAFTSGKGYSWGATGTAGTVPFVGTVVSNASLSTTSPYLVGAVAGDNLAQYDALALAPGRNKTDAWGAGGWNLLGNPFTSAMKPSTFVNDNTSSFDPNYMAVYIYAGAEGTDGRYYYYGVDGDDGATGGWSELPYGTSNLQVGQGFFVLARNNSTSFSFSNTMQVHSTGTELKSAQAPSLPGILLKAKYGTSESSTLVIYNNQMTTGLDPGYDIGLLSSGQDVELYTALAKDNGFDFARQILPLDGYEKNIIPVGVNCPKGAEVVFSAFTVPIEGGTFYLEDRITGKFTDISKETYAVTLPEKTAGTGRFFLHASQTTPIRQFVVNNNALGLRIWTADHILNIEGSVSNKAVGVIYDMLGRKILESRLTNSNLNTITLPEVVKGVYLVKVYDQGKITTQKVVF